MFTLRTSLRFPLFSTCQATATGRIVGRIRLNEGNIASMFKRLAVAAGIDRCARLVRMRLGQYLDAFGRLLYRLHHERLRYRLRVGHADPGRVQRAGQRDI